MTSRAISGAALAAVVAVAAVRPCTAANGQVATVSIPSPSLAGSVLANDAQQPALVYLPPAYRTGSARFPVVYYLPGFDTDVGEYVDGSLWGWRLDEALDRGIGAGSIDDLIVVVVNGRNALGGSFYVDSPVTGRWASYVVEDVVPWVDAHFRTIERREARALAGDSMGGFGALTLAMRHADLFSAVYALSPGLFAPGGLDEAAILSRHRAAGVRVLERLWTGGSAAGRPFSALVSALETSGSRFNDYNGFFFAYGAAFSPDLENRLSNVGFAFTGSGEFDETTHARFENGFGGWEDKVEAFGEDLRSLESVVLDCGRNDSHTWIPQGCDHLATLLHAAGVRVELRLHDGGHIDTLGERLETVALPELSHLLHREGS